MQQGGEWEILKSCQERKQSVLVRLRRRGLLAPLGSWPALGNCLLVRLLTAQDSDSGARAMGVNTSGTLCLEKESRECIWATHRRALSPHQLHLHPVCESKGIAKKEIGKGVPSQQLVHIPAIYWLYGLHKPLKVSKTWSCFPSIVLLRAVG